MYCRAERERDGVHARTAADGARRRPGRPWPRPRAGPPRWGLRPPATGRSRPGAATRRCTAHPPAASSAAPRRRPAIAAAPSGPVTSPTGSYPWPPSRYEPRGGPDRADGHLVLGQGAGLVGADHGRAAQRLHRRQPPDHRAPPGHPPDADRQRDGHGGREPLRDRPDRQRDRRAEHLRPGLAPKHADGEGDGGEAQDHDGEDLAEPGQPPGQRGGERVDGPRPGGGSPPARSATRWPPRSPPPSRS